MLIICGGVSNLCAAPGTPENAKSKQDHKEQLENNTLLPGICTPHLCVCVSSCMSSHDASIRGKDNQPDSAGHMTSFMSQNLHIGSG